MCVTVLHGVIHWVFIYLSYIYCETFALLLIHTIICYAEFTAIYNRDLGVPVHKSCN